MHAGLPSDPIAVVRDERALRDQHRWAEAEALLAAAVAAWPDDETLLADFGLLAQQQMHWAEMAARFAVLHQRHPGNLFGYSRLGEALRWLGRFDEAEGVIGAGVPRFPDNAELLVQWVLVACDRAARGASPWAEAEARGTAFVERVADAAEAYRYRAEPFLLRALWPAAELAVAEGLHRIGPAPPLVLMFADIAIRAEDWAAAARRYAAALRHLPDAEAAYLGRARALRELGRFEELETLSAGARARLPASPAIAREHALAASLRRDWPAALARWRALAAVTPEDSSVRERIKEAELQGIAMPAAVAAPAGAPPPPADLNRLLLHFEPLGEDYQFGLVQRHIGLEPPGLLRFSSIRLDDLIAALDTDFAGIGAPEFTHVLLRDGAEYIINDTRHGVAMRTFIGPDEVLAPHFTQSVGRRLAFLAGELLEDIRESAKLFVRTSHARERPERILRLHRALARHGPATLLFVSEATEPQQIGRAAWLTEGVMEGWIERFSLTDPCHAQWHTLCRAAYSLWHDGTPTGPRQATVPVVQPIAFAPAMTFGGLGPPSR